MINLPLVIALNTSTYTEIVLPAGQAGRRFTCCVSDGTACTIAIDSTGTGAYVTLADLYFIIEDAIPKGGTVCWALASAGTPDFQALVER